MDAAIAWAVKLEYGAAATDEQRRAFEHWLALHPLNALAWHRLESLKAPFTGTSSELVRGTLEMASARRDGRQAGRRRAVKMLSLVAMAVGAGWSMREQAPWQRLLADANTGVGERKTVQLVDGSRVVLNTDSAISSELTGRSRRVVLRRGEVSISTGQDLGVLNKRPFWVDTPFGRVEALGTRFTLRLASNQVRVSVQHGAVALHPPDSGRAEVIGAGETRWMGVRGSSPADLGGFDADGWVDGVLAGQNLRLADVLLELGRYRRGWIICDERVADLRVSGLIHLHDTDQALQFLLQTQPIRVKYRTRYWVTVGPR